MQELGITAAHVDEFCSTFRAPRATAATGGLPLPEGWWADRWNGRSLRLRIQPHRGGMQAAEAEVS